MKHIDTHLNENDYRKYKKEIEKRRTTQYALTQKLILEFLDKEAQKDVCMTIAFWFICYSLIAASIVIFVL